MRQAQKMLGEYAPGEHDTYTNRAIRSLLSGKPSTEFDRDIVASDYLKQVKLPMMRAFQEDIEPAIRSSFRGVGGMWSKSRGMATRRALEGLQTQLTSGLAERQWGASQLNAQLREAALGRQMQAMPLAEAFGNRALSRAGALITTAAPFQQYAQSLISAKTQEFLRTQPSESPWLKLGMQYIAQPQQEVVGIQGTQGPDWFGGAVQLGSTAMLAHALAAGAGGAGGAGAAAALI